MCVAVIFPVHASVCLRTTILLCQIYDSTLYAKKAQLRRVDLSDVDSALPPGSADVFGTPTFLIVENNTEIGRIEGYQSKEMFFWALSEYIQP